LAGRDREAEPSAGGEAAKALGKAEEDDEDAASGTGGPVAATARGSERAPAALADRCARKERRSSRDALRGHGKVESRGCPHCAGRDIVAWGRANGLARYRCKSCGRTFNAVTKTAMAGLRKKEQ
jgi:Zn ribbon nucleic-acid-binding protein